MYAKLLSLPLSVLGKVLSAVGSAQLLMSQKFQQFRGLCEQNLVSDSTYRASGQPLAALSREPLVACDLCTEEVLPSWHYKDGGSTHHAQYRKG